MNCPYLILHRVRGEAAFDIAERLDNETWIIPTIGHRAYPWRFWALEDLGYISDIIDLSHFARPINFIEKLPANWRDHYVAAKPKSPRLGQLVDTLVELNPTPEELAEALAAVRGKESPK